MVEEQNVHQNANGNAKNHIPDGEPKAIGEGDILSPRFPGRYAFRL